MGHLLAWSIERHNSDATKNSDFSLKKKLAYITDVTRLEFFRSEDNKKNAVVFKKEHAEKLVPFLAKQLQVGVGDKAYIVLIDDERQPNFDTTKVRTNGAFSWGDPLKDLQDMFKRPSKTVWPQPVQKEEFVLDALTAPAL